MITLDIMLKDVAVRMATQLPRVKASAIAARQQLYADYLLKVFDAPITTQIAVRDAAASGGELENQFARILTVLLSPVFRVVSTRLSIPVTLPSEIVWAEADAMSFPPAGSFLLNTSHGSQLVHYTGIVKSPFFSSLTQFTGCTGGSGSAGQGNVITAAVEGLDMSASAIQARKDLFIAAFTRRSRNAIGALNFINDKHVWSWDKLQP